MLYIKEKVNKMTNKRDRFRKFKEERIKQWEDKNEPQLMLAKKSECMLTTMEYMDKQEEISDYLR